MRFRDDIPPGRGGTRSPADTIFLLAEEHPIKPASAAPLENVIIIYYPC